MEYFEFPQNTVGSADKLRWQPCLLALRDVHKPSFLTNITLVQRFHCISAQNSRPQPPDKPVQSMWKRPIGYSITALPASLAFWRRHELAAATATRWWEGHDFCDYAKLLKWFQRNGQWKYNRSVLSIVLAVVTAEKTCLKKKMLSTQEFVFLLLLYVNTTNRL